MIEALEDGVLQREHNFVDGNFEAGIVFVQESREISKAGLASLLSNCGEKFKVEGENGLARSSSSAADKKYEKGFRDIVTFEKTIQIANTPQLPVF